MLRSLLITLFISSVAMIHADEDLPTLTIVTEDVYPLNYIDEPTGEFKGFAVDYLKDILAQTDINYSINVYPWPRAYKTALSQPNVLIFGLARTESRESKFIWLTDFITLDFYLYALKSRRDSISRPDNNYIDSPIGVIRNDYNHIEMESAGYQNLVPAEDHKHLAFLLRKERVDFIVAGGTSWNFFDVRNDLDSDLLYRAKPLEFLNVPIYYAMSKGSDQALIAELRNAITKLKQDPDYVQPSAETTQVDSDNSTATDDPSRPE